MFGCSRRAWWGLAWVWLGLACGPTVELEDDGTASSSGTGSTTTSPPATVGPTTAATTAMTSVGEVTSGVDVDTGDTSVLLDVFIPEDCSPIEQDCPRGYKCMPWANDDGNVWNDTKCVPIVEDPSAPGEPCTVVGSGTSGEDDCDGTSMCWDVDPETNMGTCQPFCTGTEDRPTCADLCDECSIASDAVITLCFTTCDPLVQDCPPGQACYVQGDDLWCVPDASLREGAIGSPCEFVNVCDPGLVCLDASTVPGCPGGSWGCCTPYCALAGPDPCPGLLPGSTCVPLFEDGEGPPEACVIAPVGACMQ